MSLSIQELDSTVRAFYEGKGDVVSYSRIYLSKNPIYLIMESKLLTVNYRLAKTSAAEVDRSKPDLTPKRLSEFSKWRSELIA